MSFSSPTITRRNYSPLIGIQRGHRNCVQRSRELNVISWRTTSFSYQKFADFAVHETKRCTHLTPSLLQDEFASRETVQENARLNFLSFKSEKIRLLRSLCIDSTELKVLDFAVFPETRYDLPIFCASFFTTSKANIIVLDLNPVFNTTNNPDYMEKYYRELMPLGHKYSDVFPWGGLITAESVEFFSPIVIWAKLTPSCFSKNEDLLFSAFKDYYNAWLGIMCGAFEEIDSSQIQRNTDAQHRYLTWRSEKEPGFGVLKKLVGEADAVKLVRGFLFKGVDDLSNKSFLDYFPQYQCGEGAAAAAAISRSRSMIGRSFRTRPWNSEGHFIVDS